MLNWRRPCTSTNVPFRQYCLLSQRVKQLQGISLNHCHQLVEGWALARHQRSFELCMISLVGSAEQLQIVVYARLIDAYWFFSNVLKNICQVWVWRIIGSGWECGIVFVWVNVHGIWEWWIMCLGWARCCCNFSRFMTKVRLRTLKVLYKLICYIRGKCYAKFRGKKVLALVTSILSLLLLLLLSLSLSLSHHRVFKDSPFCYYSNYKLYKALNLNWREKRSYCALRMVMKLTQRPCRLAITRRFCHTTILRAQYIMHYFTRWF